MAPENAVRQKAAVRAAEEQQKALGSAIGCLVLIVVFGLLSIIGSMCGGQSSSPTYQQAETKQERDDLRLHEAAEEIRRNPGKYGF